MKSIVIGSLARQPIFPETQPNDGQNRNDCRSKPDTHLKIFGDYQNFLIDTWKSDKQRPAIYGNASTTDWSGHLWKELR